MTEQRTATVVVPEGYRSAQEFATDCGVQLVSISDAMVFRALAAWFSGPQSETDQGLERSMHRALAAALNEGASPNDVSTETKGA